MRETARITAFVTNLRKQIFDLGQVLQLLDRGGKGAAVFPALLQNVRKDPERNIAVEQLGTRP
jgi:hypothetical protein